jgi:hypothetical protein
MNEKKRLPATSAHTAPLDRPSMQPMRWSGSSFALTFLLFGILLSQQDRP